MPHLCPLCNKDDKIAKISAIVSSQTTHVTDVAYDYSLEMFRNRTFDNKSDLARLLTPPRQPRAISGLIYDLISVYSVALGQILIFFIPFLFGGGAIGLFVATIGILLVIALTINKYKKTVSSHKKLQKKYLDELSKWKVAMQKWNHSYYCERDDIVFNPETSETTSPTNLTKYLYQTSP